MLRWVRAPPATAHAPAQRQDQHVLTGLAPSLPKLAARHHTRQQLAFNGHLHQGLHIQAAIRSDTDELIHDLPPAALQLREALHAAVSSWPQSNALRMV
jgi:hypothetical protein